MKKGPKKRRSIVKAMFLEKDAQDMAIFIAASNALGIEPQVVTCEEDIGEIVKDRRPDVVFLNCLDFDIRIIMDIKETSPDSLIVVVDGNESEEVLAKEFGVLYTLDKDRVIGMLKLVRRSRLPMNDDLFPQRSSMGKKSQKQRPIFKVMFLGKDGEDMLIFNAVADVLGIEPQVVMCEEYAVDMAKNRKPDVVFIDCYDFHPRIIMDIKEACSSAMMIAVNCIGDNETLAKEFGILTTLENHRVIGMLKMVRKKIINGEAAFR